MERVRKTANKHRPCVYWTYIYGGIEIKKLLKSSLFMDECCTNTSYSFNVVLMKLLQCGFYITTYLLKDGS